MNCTSPVALNPPFVYLIDPLIGPPVGGLQLGQRFEAKEPDSRKAHCRCESC